MTGVELLEASSYADTLDLYISLRNSAEAFYEKFEEEGEIEHVEKAISDWRQAFALFPPDDLHHAPAVRRFAYALKEHSELNQAKEVEGIDESIRLFRLALALVPLEQKNCYLFVSGLAGGLHSRFERHHRLDNLMEAYHLNLEAWEICPTDDPNHSIMSHNLASTLCAMFKQHEPVADFDEAVNLLRNSLLADCDEIKQPSGCITDTEKDVERVVVDASRLSAQGDFAKVLLSRFDSKRKREDLDEAICHLREILRTCSSDFPGASINLNRAAHRTSHTIRRPKECH